MSSAPPRPVSVSELTGHVKAILEGTFPSICVEGEISDLTKPRSGHIYFTLKDEHSQIRGVIWRSTAARMTTQLKEGQSVLCFGDVEVYAARGTYSLVVRKVQTQGLGPLQQAFLELKQKLNAEGLFAAERKRPLPRFPKRLGVVTSPSGAAIRDFLKAAAQRWPGVEILIIPTLVQGQGASESIAKAIRTAQSISPSLDTLVVTRGGGSLEDLWCFNEEPVVRAIAQCNIPTISAVGHEVDITLCDLAADVRALTPTDGATCALPDRDLVVRSLTDMRARLDRTARNVINTRQNRLDALQTRSILKRPHELVQRRFRQLDELDARGRKAMFTRMQLNKAKLGKAAATLSALSPLNVLARGYSVTLDSHDNTIQNPSQLKPGDVIRSRVEHGDIESVVKTIKTYDD
ncbi:exodeoxyribonuclease VII large subunit [bacterium]|nr:exodeoxyribonuclease VII large subunit [Pseudomonadales bacterium]MDC0317598.1 exodeoxyribonuclease VII large subunit [bacterium]